MHGSTNIYANLLDRDNRPGLLYSSCVALVSPSSFATIGLTSSHYILVIVICSRWSCKLVSQVAD